MYDEGLMIIYIYISQNILSFSQNYNCTSAGSVCLFPVVFIVNYILSDLFLQKCTVVFPEFII
jgi:hypothetical protein